MVRLIQHKYNSKSLNSEGEVHVISMKCDKDIKGDEHSSFFIQFRTNEFKNSKLPHRLSSRKHSECRPGLGQRFLMTLYHAKVTKHVATVKALLLRKKSEHLKKSLTNL